MALDNGHAIVTSGLTRDFGAFRAVDNVSLSVKRGEIFGFLGPNGAGKSTTIRMLSGLLMPTGGSGSINGLDILSEPEEIKRTIGYMSQSFSLYPDLTVEENIDFFSGIYLIPRQKRQGRKEHVLELAGLKGRRSTLTRDLPRGHKQRLALGTAILHEPPVLFLDEPTSGVDPISRRSFWDLIHTMSRAGTTVLVTTHYMDEAEYCDRLCMIYRGRIIAEDSPSALRTTGTSRQVLELDVDRPFEAIEALAAGGVDAAVFGSVLHASVDDADAALPAVTGALRDAGIALRRAERIAPSLEDVFVALIEEA